MKVSLSLLNTLHKIPSAQWHRFGVHYKSIQTLSNGQVIGGTLTNNRRFTLNTLTNKFEFLPS